MNYRAYQEDSLALDPASPFFLDHVSRYLWAAKAFAGEKRVLDCACGHGYGSYILSKQAKTVRAVDPATSLDGAASLRRLFDGPIAGTDEYIFSPWHWRQAGLTLAVCRAPRVGTRRLDQASLGSP